MKAETKALLTVLNILRKKPYDDKWIARYNGPLTHKQFQDLDAELVIAAYQILTELVN